MRRKQTLPLTLEVPLHPILSAHSRRSTSRIAALPHFRKLPFVVLRSKYAAGRVAM